MTDDEQIKLRAIIALTAAYYNQQLADPVVAMYVKDLSDLNFNLVSEALNNIRRNPNTRKCPLPAEIRASVEHSDDNADAREIASKIYSAISKYGWTNSDRARLYIGHLGWQIVELQGGWENVCAIYTSDNTSTLLAQWRELASGLQRKVRTFVKTGDKQQIDNQNKVVELIENSIKSL